MGFLTEINFKLIFILSCVAAADCFSTGAPFSSCLARFPKHESDAQTTTSPYTTTTSEDTYTPSTDITVTVKATDPAIMFKGVLLTAHRETSSGNSEQYIGFFTAVTPTKIKELQCLDQPKAAITHNNSDSVNSIVVKWTPPNTNMGTVVLSAVIVQSKSVFWISNTKTVNGPSTTVTQPPYKLPNISPTFSAIDWTACGKTKGCFLHPASCKGADCTAAISYQKTGSDYTFEMFAKAKGYVAMGLSKDKTMSDDETILCTAVGSEVTIQHGYNYHIQPFKFNTRQYTMDLTNVQAKQENGNVYCRFTRPQKSSVTTIQNSKIEFDLSNKWYVMLAWGKVYTGTSVIAKHEETPVITDAMINVGFTVNHANHVGESVTVITLAVCFVTRVLS